MELKVSEVPEVPADLQDVITCTAHMRRYAAAMGVRRPVRHLRGM